MWMQDVCEVYMAFVHGIKWIVFHGHLDDYFQNHLLEGGLTQYWETMALRTLTTRWLILLYHVWGPTWIEIHRKSTWLRAQSHMASHYTWGFVSKLHDLGGVLGRPWDTFFWALIISWSRLLALELYTTRMREVGMDGWSNFTYDDQAGRSVAGWMKLVMFNNLVARPPPMISLFLASFNSDEVSCSPGLHHECHYLIIISDACQCCNLNCGSNRLPLRKESRHGLVLTDLSPLPSICNERSIACV